MAIGTLAAIGLGLAGAGAAASAISTGKAASKAADATTAAADRSAEVIQRNYDLSAQALQPWQQQGLQANMLLNDFYGIGQPQQQTPAMSGQFGQFGGQQFGPMGGLGQYYNDLAYGGAFGDSPMGGLYGLAGMQGQFPTYGTMNATPQAAPSSRDAFRKFIENSDYGFQFGQGANKVNSGYAGAGSLKSGAAMKALEDYRQNLQQGYRGEFVGGLGNQQSLGFGAASAQAGVSQNLGNNLANIYTNQGANLANAALAKTSPIGGALGMIGGGLFGLGKG